MAKNFDLISIGDATSDVFLEIDEATVLCAVKKESCQLCINYADKVPVKKITKISLAGNAANVAVGASRLGLKSAFFTILGNDDMGKEIFKKLKAEGVARDYIKFDKKRGTNYSTVISFKGERTILVFHERRDYRFSHLAKAKWVYLTSMGVGHESLYKPLIKYLKKNKTKLGFNPGTFQLKLGLIKLRPIIKLTTIFIVNKEEAERLAGKLKSVKELLLSLKKEGPKIVVITDGIKGSYAFDGKKVYFQDIFAAPIVERTGCGDSYAAGFLCALAYGYDIPVAMRWGAINAASVLQKIGSQEGLLSRREVERTLSKNPKI
ncbi:carbohydrate kinase family protein [Candidatus Wolfebacteria bacterium]|nr:carbohydrate kinase family protein [Candidatus Wolfebacteria bacterium]